MLEHPPLVWAEIAVTDMNRAMAFYQDNFALTFKQETINDMEMAIVETTTRGDASVALLKHEMMVPSRDGSTVYLHLTATLQNKVTELERANVEMVLPAMPIKDGECGYIAIFIDSEGNKIGLWSQNL
jgi:uncharacterized protein